jgi:hypothetical protein
MRYFELSTVLEAERVLAHCNSLSYSFAGQYEYFPVDNDDNLESGGLDINLGDRYNFKGKLCILSLDPNNCQRLLYKWANKEYSNVDGLGIDDETYLKVASRIWNSKNGGRLDSDGNLICFSECQLPNSQTI